MITNIKAHWKEHLATTTFVILIVTFIGFTVVYTPIIWVWLYCLGFLAVVVGALNSIGLGDWLIELYDKLLEKFK